MQDNKVDPGRRKFLHAVRGAGLIGAAAALLGRPARIEAATAEPAQAPAANGNRGYHETEHIRKYYYAARYF
jgi:hypothetical protein